MKLVFQLVNNVPKGQLEDLIFEHFYLYDPFIYSVDGVIFVELEVKNAIH